MTKRRATLLRTLIEQGAISLDDASALTGPELFPAWAAGIAYVTGARVRYGETLYGCVQGHTSLENWTPDITPALWKRVTVEEWPEWIQPTGAQDAYAKGDHVTHGGKRWTSIVDANVWEPGVYGWEEC